MRLFFRLSMRMGRFILTAFIAFLVLRLVLTHYPGLLGG